MNYFVILSDGQKFGPANVTVLSQWAAEGRLLPGAMLENATTMQQVLASSVPGIVWPNQPNMGQQAQPPSYGQPTPTAYPRQDFGMPNMAPESWIDRTFTGTAFPILIIFSICCGAIALIFSLIQVITGQEGEARRRAKICLIISGVITALGIFSRIGGSR